MSPEEASRHLNTFAATGCERAFRKLTEGHAGLVYSTALRVGQGDAALAEDVVQIVFSALAAKPHSVRDGKALAAWLHRAAVRRAIDARRVDSRRRKREQLYAHMTPPTHSDAESSGLWEHASAVIDRTIDRLPEIERQLLVLRFWQRQDLRTIGMAYGISDNAVQKRLTRSLEKLRLMLAREGIRGTTSTVAAAMLGAAVSTPSPASLAGVTASSLALANAGPATSFIMHTLGMTAKQALTVTSAAVLVAIGAPAYFQQQKVKRLETELDALRPPPSATAPAPEIGRLESPVARLHEPAPVPQLAEKGQGSSTSQPASTSSAPRERVPAPRPAAGGTVERRLAALEEAVKTLQQTMAAVSVEKPSADRQALFAAEDGYLKADEYAAAGQHAIAGEGYLTFLRHHPDHPDARDVMKKSRDCFLKAGYKDKAFWVHEEMMTSFPQFRSGDLWEQARLEKDAGLYDKAVAHAAQAAELASNLEEKLWRRIYWAGFVQLRDGPSGGIAALEQVQKEIASSGVANPRLAENAAQRMQEWRQILAKK